jgi:hypothetical protein
VLVPRSACGEGSDGGYWLSVAILAANLLGDVANGVFRHDWGALIGVPISGAILLYLARSDIRHRFQAAG